MLREGLAQGTCNSPGLGQSLPRSIPRHVMAKPLSVQQGILRSFPVNTNLGFTHRRQTDESFSEASVCSQKIMLLYNTNFNCISHIRIPSYDGPLMYVVSCP